VPLGATREILDAALLGRVNTDASYMTEPWPPLPKFWLEFHATAPGSESDIAGSTSTPLSFRFDLHVDQADVNGRPANLADFRCFVNHRRAWQP
jgi:hypothetical protein